MWRGSIAKVAAILEGGREVVIWQGRHDASDSIVDAPFNAPAGLTARAVKVYLDTARVPGREQQLRRLTEGVLDLGFTADPLTR